MITLDEVQVGDALPPLSYDVTATTVVLGALAAATGGRCTTTTTSRSNRNGVQDIFLNTPNQAAWFERYVTDWTGPTGRLGRMRFRMKPVFPGDTMVLEGTVARRRASTTPAAAGSSSTSPSASATTTCTECAAQVAVPTVARRQPVGAPRRPTGDPEEERWISTSRPSRRCCARRCAGVCARHCGLDVVRADGGRPGRLPRQALEAARPSSASSA